MIRFLEKYWPFLVLLALAIFLFLPQIISGSIPYAGDYTGSDLTELNIPFRQAVADSFRNGEFPLWTNLLANGWPLLAEGQAGAIYPLNILVYLLLPIALAVLVSLIINFFLASLFTYLYARVIKLSRPSAIFAAVAFSYSGFFLFRIKHLNLINAAIWLPLGWYLIEKYLKSFNKKFLVWLGIVLAIQFLAGHPQISYITILSSFVYFVLRYISISEKKSIIIHLKQIIGSWALIGLLTFGLSAIQFLPTYELSKISTRSEWISYDTSVQFNFHPIQFFSAFSPYMFGNPATGDYQGFDLGFSSGFWESNLYFGILSLLLVFYYFYYSFKKRKYNSVLLLVSLLSVFLILGKFFPLYPWLWENIPGMKIFRFSQRFLLVLGFCLAVFAAMGFDVIYIKARTWLVNNKKYHKSKFLSVGLPAIVILILVIDLFFVASEYIGSLPKDYFDKPQSAEFIQEQKELTRSGSFFYQLTWMNSYELSGGWQNNMALFVEGRELIQPDLNMMYGVELYNDRGWNEGGQLDARLSHIFQRIDQSFFANEEGKIVLPDSSLKVLGMQNVKYLLSFFEIRSDNLALVKEIPQRLLPPLKIYENRFFLPRAFLVGSVEVVAIENEVLNRMFGQDFDFSQVAVVESDINIDISSDQSESDLVDIISYDNQEMIFDIKVVSPKLLVVSKTFYPGWQALVDGQKRDLIRVNNAFSAVVVYPEDRRVNFEYQPKSFIMGSNISLITLILVLIFLITDYLNSNKKGNKLWLPKKI